MAAGNRDVHNIAMFVDLENVAIGVHDAHYERFDVRLVLRRLLEKGNVVVKKAYADFHRHLQYKRPLHDEAIELIDIPERRSTGKNSADIKMVVDAMELSYTKSHIDGFALVSGDSDFSPVVSKLRENNKFTIGVGVKNSSSPLLIDNCDEFVFYDDLVRTVTKRKKTPSAPGVTKEKQEAFDLLLETLTALQRESQDVMWSSLVKDTMKRKQPQFNEEYHGYTSFSKLLEDAQRHKLISLRRDQKSGTYVVEEPNDEPGGRGG